MSGLRLGLQALDLRLRHTFRIARGASDTRENLLVELEAEGHCGHGEAAPILRYGQDRASAARAVEVMAGRPGDPRQFASASARAGVPGQSAAEAAADIALHDMAGRRLGVPLYELLGLDPRHLRRIAAWTRRWPCRWRANLAPSHGPVLQPFTVRQDAIAAEVAWLNDNL